MIRRGIQKRAFSALYGPLARVYDRFTRWLFLGEWERWQETVLPHLPSTGVVVELGSGTGRLAHISASPGRFWIGIERSPSMLRIARRDLERFGPFLVQADATKLPIRSAAALAVVATFPTCYILERRAAEEIRRILAPKGVLVVVLSGDLAPHGYRRRLRRLALRFFYGHARSDTGTASMFAGIAGHQRQVSTDHGEATLFIGLLEATSVG